MSFHFQLVVDSPVIGNFWRCFSPTTALIFTLAAQRNHLRNFNKLISGIHPQRFWLSDLGSGQPLKFLKTPQVILKNRQGSERLLKRGAGELSDDILSFVATKVKST